MQQDELVIKSISLGELQLKSKVFSEAHGVVADKCSGSVVANVFFGETGVGKSTIASLVAGTPGLFRTGTSGHGSTTRGTWISSPINLNSFVHSAKSNLGLTFDQHDISTESKNVLFLDTEGLDYQTEVGPNYDVVTILPHTIIAENVFLVVSDRLRPAEVLQLVDKLVRAAERAK